MIALILLLVIASVIVFGIALYLHILAKYRVVVPPNEADVVINKDGKRMYTTNTVHNPDGQAKYYKFPERWPYFGKTVVRVPLDIFTSELNGVTLFDKSRARFNCDVTVFLEVADVYKFAEKADTLVDLDPLLYELIEPNARGATTRKSVQTILTDHTDIVAALKEKLAEEVTPWGLNLTNVQILKFYDYPGTKTVTNTHLQREKELEASMRKDIAIKEQDAIIKEAEAQEKAEKRIIEMEENIEKREQEKNKMIFEKEKEAVTAGYEVENVELTAHEKNIKEQSILIGEGKHELAKGEAEAKVIFTKREGEVDANVITAVGEAEAGIRKKKLVAEGEGLEKIQKSVKDFTPLAKEVMIAEAVVEKDRQVEVATAEALSTADLKILASGDGEGFSMAQLMQSIKLGHGDTAEAILNKIARPNDLGLASWKELPGKMNDPKIQSKLKKLFE